MKPMLVVLAGPNGSGKSTLCATPQFSKMLDEQQVMVINPDEIAKAAPSNANSLIWSGREVHRRIDALIASRTSFLVETTLSGRNHFKTVSLARTAGYYVGLHYVFVSDLERSKARVQFRVLTGGHDVPEADQERRYDRSFENCLELLNLTDEAYIYCNDFDHGHERVAIYEQGRCTWLADQPPSWLTDNPITTR